MKKKFLFCALAGAIGFAGVKSYEMSQESEMTSLMMQNVEALSGNESSNEQPLVCYKTITTSENCTVLYCGGCVWVDGTPTLLSRKDKCNAY